ncbi:uncharacterized protein YcbK (DUF882 family) [Caulobacter ginsengisoli]|uniref:Murein endopeptidase K n=1 Tax=Caulobacter ginsengisoli TaxID=400775 RepID=A0ABU0IN08_9CAUL|nr:DUF882 domain-containing protein [Caulobacter ginsengisoli]MDQ0463403.1 uncharacterized protein YcbK (DUF882 family) [Caulobacter ginsengisoli]
MVTIPRRGLLGLGAGLGLAAAGMVRAEDVQPPLPADPIPPEAPFRAPTPVRQPPPGPRRLVFRHLHTLEDLDVVYWADGYYLGEPIAQIRHLLRDFRTQEEHFIDNNLLDLLCTLRAATGTREPYRIISAFRSPETNEMLRDQSAAANPDGPQVAKKSQHMEGRAIDLRLIDVSLTGLHQTALSLKGGGVGIYPDSDFIHVDVGPVRTWQGS